MAIQVSVNPYDLDGEGLSANGTSFELDINTDNSTIEVDGSDNIRVKVEGITANEIGTGAVTSDEILDGTIQGHDLHQNGASNGQVLIWNGTSWVPGTNNDNDSDPTNEYNTGATLTGNTLNITDAGGTQSVDLSALNNPGTDDQNLTGATLNGSSVLTINIENGSSTNVNLSALEESADIAQVASDLTTHTSADQDLSSSNELQTLSLSGNQLSISSGNTINLPPDNDSDPTNEIQDLSSTTSGTNRTINITGGAGTTISVADNDNNSSNELQSLSISGSTISLTNGGGSVTVPSSADNLGNHTATTNVNMVDNNILDANTVQLNVIEDPEDGLVTLNDDLDLNGILYPIGIRLPNSFAPNTAFVGATGNYISFGHPGVSEDFLGYANNTFYLKDSPGGGDNSDPNLVIGGNAEIGGQLNMTSGRIINLATPTAGTDAATKAYVDAHTDADANPTNEIQSLSISGSTISLTNGGGSVTVPSTADNLGNHVATTNLNMNNREIDNLHYLDMRPGNGYGVRFWSDNNYSISMGNATTYRYGPVTDYSIKNNMSNTPARGWTWGVWNQTPVAALNTQGAMQLEGTLKVSNNNATGGGLVISDDGGIFDRNDAYGSLAFSAGIDIEDAQDNGDHLLINFNDSYPEILGYRNNGATLVEFKTGMYNNGGTFYSQNQIYSRTGIANDQGNLLLNDNVTVSSLGGGGTRMVVTDNSGNLTAQSIPSGADNLGNHSATATLQMNDNWIFLKNNVTTNPGARGLSWHGGSLSYSIYQEAGAWSSPYPDLMVRFHTGIKLSAESAYGGIRLYAGSGEAHTASFNASGQQLHQGTLQIATLGGGGNRMVIADNSGNLSTQAIPVGGCR